MSDEGSAVEEREEAQRIPKLEAAEEARALLRQTKFGVLATLSKRHEGWPFGSIVPYAIDRWGAPLILVASIAEHTKNLRADPRVSLLVHEDATGGGDVQARGRVTLLAKATEIAPAALDDARARYLARVPDARGYFATHDFTFVRLEPVKVRFIGGFGKIFWLDAEAIAVDPARDPLLAAAPGILSHMNRDHADALVICCLAFAGIETGAATMVGVDRFGFDVECDAEPRRLRLDFDHPAEPATIRQAVVDVVKRARAITGTSTTPAAK